MPVASVEMQLFEVESTLARRRAVIGETTGTLRVDCRVVASDEGELIAVYNSLKLGIYEGPLAAGLASRGMPVGSLTALGLTGFDAAGEFLCDDGNRSCAELRALGGARPPPEVDLSPLWAALGALAAVVVCCGCCIGVVIFR